ncbi:MAG: bifunctional UDP-N-acetylglucosamine diphosphorylase/glucosamine-1-phosphate N-acetyltransferase GlmU [Proteobacteria bacterium]|nr:bifunctional UDP-N-acetylglucosamine diphosphorylase/glucosamine-1-phosphate N-acetyltransferase GlmU [Pseudomonadota bacterium]
MQTAVIILAAGLGKRMNSDIPKVLHKVAGAPLILHSIRAASALDPEKIIVVTGHDATIIEDEVSKTEPEVAFAHQKQQNGTGHAVTCASSLLKDFTGNTIILYGDVPFISPETLTKMVSERHNGVDIVVLGFQSKDPGKYGRLIFEEGDLKGIIEAKDATKSQLNINLCNSGVISADANQLFELLLEVTDDNASKEYYLTDIVGLARKKGLSIKVIFCDETETTGVNTRSELAVAEDLFQKQARTKALEDGVTLVQPETTYFAFDTVIGRDTSIGPNVVFGPGVSIESGVEVFAFCHLEGCHISRGAKVGPFARLRPGTELNEDVKIGNFVELKNSIISQGTKVNHLSYIGDTTVGEKTNIGAGTITCNYDGTTKYPSTIGDRAFIGSNTMLVAPISIGNDVITAAGTVVTKNIPDGDLAISRTKQENKSGYAAKLKNKKPEGY